MLLPDLDVAIFRTTKLLGRKLKGRFLPTGAIDIEFA
jgi:hypothetical protein